MFGKLKKVDKELSASVYNLSTGSKRVAKLIEKSTIAGGSIPLWIVISLASSNFLKTFISLFILISIIYLGSEKCIKKIFKRKRPSYSILKSPSFPSTHALCTLALTLFVYLTNPNASAALIGGVVIYSALIAFSRVYLGFHYISDIVGGWVLGIVFGVLGSAIYIFLS